MDAADTPGMDQSILPEPELHHWGHISYLAGGSTIQRAAYHALQDLGIMRVLSPFNPTLVGTIPIEIDIPGSDLDIICEAHDLEAFSDIVAGTYEGHKEFKRKVKTINSLPTFIASFIFQEFPIQIFAQPQPIEQQNAFRHMLVEAHLLEIGGPKARQEIRNLKLAGMKTEPAFGFYFKIPGNPYDRLLELSWLSLEDLRSTLKIER